MFAIQIYDPKHQIKWDNLLDKCDFYPLNGSKTIGFTYLRNKQQYSFQGRDFYEKGFAFYHKGKFYRYTTSVPDEESLSMMPLPDETVRASTILYFGMVERDPSNNNKIKLQSCAQCDFKVTVPAFMVNQFLPNSTKTWYSSI